MTRLTDCVVQVSPQLQWTPPTVMVGNNPLMVAHHCGAMASAVPWAPWQLASLDLPSMTDVCCCRDEEEGGG